MAAFRSILAAAVIVTSATGACADTLQDAKDATAIMVGSGAICADYLKKPDVLEEMRKRSLEGLTGAGLSEAEANALMDAAVQEAMSEPSNETQMQVACEIVGIKALPVD